MDLVSDMETNAATTATAEDGKSKSFPAEGHRPQTKCHNIKQSTLITVLFTVATTAMGKDQESAPPVAENNSSLSTSTLP